MRFAAHAGPHAAVIPLLSASGLDRAALALANLHNDINIFTSTFALQGIWLNFLDFLWKASLTPQSISQQ